MSVLETAYLKLAIVVVSLYMTAVAHISAPGSALSWVVTVLAGVPLVVVLAWPLVGRASARHHQRQSTCAYVTDGGLWPFANERHSCDQLEAKRPNDPEEQRKLAQWMLLLEPGMGEFRVDDALMRYVYDSEQGVAHRAQMVVQMAAEDEGLAEASSFFRNIFLEHCADTLLVEQLERHPDALISVNPKGCATMLRDRLKKAGDLTNEADRFLKQHSRGSHKAKRVTLRL